MMTSQDIYVKKKSYIFSRHLLQTRKQNQGESLDQYLQVLRILAKYCKLEAVTAIEYRDDTIRDSFINGLQSNYIRQRFFGVRELDLKTELKQARAMEMAHNLAGSHVEHGTTAHALATPPPEPPSAGALVSVLIPASLKPNLRLQHRCCWPR